jgi:NAD(P)-dependent dehydrogenase (short-subunit alcohol dehydrogenase family)
VAFPRSFLSDNAFAGRTVVLIGGGSGIGLRVAEFVTGAGGDVVLGGRTAEKLAAAVDALGPRASWKVVDTSDQGSVDEFFELIETVHGVFTTAATYTTGSMAELTVEQAATPFDSKFWGQYRVVKSALPKLAADASIVLMSGAASVRPAGAAPAYVAANAAVEGLARGLAVELAPVRVNAVAPGTVDGQLWGQRSDDVRRQAFEHYAAASIVGRPVTEPEVAGTVVHLLLNSATTGSVVYPDGGYTLR